MHIPAHLPAHVSDLLFGEALLEVDDDGVEGAAVAVLQQHLEQSQGLKRATLDPAGQTDIMSGRPVMHTSSLKMAKLRLFT